MKCIVTSFGSAGDFLPTLALGAALHRRGHDVRFVANPFYESRARSAGLALTAAGELVELYDCFERNPAYGHPANAALLFRDLVAPNVVATYPVIRELLRAEPFDVVVANDATFGAFWAAAEHGVASVLVHATPAIWMSWQAPLVFGDRVPPLAFQRPMTAAARTILNWYMTRLLRPLARAMGTPFADISFRATEHMAALQLGLWSPLLRGPVASDPPNGTICGFTRSSRFGGAEPARAPEVEAFLAAGPPPVVVAFGSAFSLISGPVQTRIAEACADSGQRCLIIGHPSALAFPGNTLAVRYAPYDHVFPQAAAVVVHGGAGTTGEALRSGKPIICVPFAFDQFALSAAIEQLGVGIRVRAARRTRSDFAAALQRVRADASMRQRANDGGRRFSAERDGAEVGAEAVERLFGR